MFIDKFIEYMFHEHINTVTDHSARRPIYRSVLFSVT